MASSNPKSKSSAGVASSKLKCAIRKEWVTATPEEIIRQQWLCVLIDQLNYPPSAITVEKALHQMPHIEAVKNLPDRRADILCYTPVKGTLLPLLLIECKAHPLNEKSQQQVTGYNHYVGAKAVALVNQTEAQTALWNGSAWRFTPGLPPYKQLILA